MRTVLTALSGAALAMTLSIPTAAASSPAPQVPAQSHSVRTYDHRGGDDDYYGHDYYCHGLITRLLCWLV